MSSCLHQYFCCLRCNGTEAHYHCFLLIVTLQSCIWILLLKDFQLLAEAQLYHHSVWEMLWSPKLSLSNIHVRLTAKGLLRNIQLLSGCRNNTVVFHAGLSLIVVLNISYWAFTVIIILDNSYGVPLLCRSVLLVVRSIFRIAICRPQSRRFALPALITKMWHSVVAVVLSNVQFKFIHYFSQQQDLIFFTHTDVKIWMHYFWHQLFTSWCQNTLHLAHWDIQYFSFIPIHWGYFGSRSLGQSLRTLFLLVRSFSRTQ